MIDQAYQARLTDGMVRCYLVGNRVAGFGEQHVNALYPAAPGADPRSALEPGQRLYFPPTRADFQEIGSASCRERVCQYVSNSVVAVSLKKKNTYTSIIFQTIYY